MKKGFLKISLGLFLIFAGTSVVGALNAPTINSIESKENDLIYVKTTKGDYDVSYYLVGTSLEKAIKYTTNKLEAYLSMPNGTYNVWAVDTNGNKSDPYSITKEDGSCNMSGITNATDSGTVDMCGIMSSS